MKTQHQLPNGTLLEIGKKYKDNNNEVIEISALGNLKFLFIDEEGNERDRYYQGEFNLLPYKPEPTKELAGYQEFYVSIDNLIALRYAKDKESILNNFSGSIKPKIYTRQEAAEAGLFIEETLNKHSDSKKKLNIKPLNDSLGWVKWLEESPSHGLNEVSQSDAIRDIYIKINEVIKAGLFDEETKN